MNNNDVKNISMGLAEATDLKMLILNLAAWG